MRLAEFLARCIAARKIGLIEDKYGTRLPEDLWRQAMPDAEFIVGAMFAYDLHETVRQYYAEDDGE